MTNDPLAFMHRHAIPDRLQHMVDTARSRPEIRQYAKRRAAAKLGIARKSNIGSVK